MKILIFLLTIVSIVTSASASLKKSEFDAEIMMNNGDALRAYTLVQVEYTYRINQTYWVGVDGFAGPIVVDSANSLTDVGNGNWLRAVGPVFYLNVPALLGATKDNSEGAAQCQLYTSFGAGYLGVGSTDTIYGEIGGGLIWEFKPWLGLRFDLKSIFYTLNNTTGSSFNSDLALSIGPSFVF